MCIGECKDPFVTFLKSVGYNTIRLPRAEIRPLQILAMEGRDLTWMGDLAEVFRPEPGTTLPRITLDEQAANIQGKRTGDMNIGVALSIMGTVIGAMGGSNLGLDVQYKAAKSASFEFNDVFSDSVSVAVLDQFLGGSNVDARSIMLGKMLDADRIYVTTRTLKSRKLLVEGRQSHGAAVTVDVPVLQGIVGGKVKVGGTGDKTTKVTYEGPTPLVFGFQAVRLFYEGTRYTALEPLAPGRAAARGLGDDTDEPAADPLLVESTFAPLRMS